MKLVDVINRFRVTGMMKDLEENMDMIIDTCEEDRLVGIAVKCALRSGIQLRLGGEILNAASLSRLMKGCDRWLDSGWGESEEYKKKFTPSLKKDYLDLPYTNSRCEMCGKGWNNESHFYTPSLSLTLNEFDGKSIECCPSCYQADQGQEWGKACGPNKWGDVRQVYSLVREGYEHKDIQKASLSFVTPRCLRVFFSALNINWRGGRETGEHLYCAFRKRLVEGYGIYNKATYTSQAGYLRGSRITIWCGKKRAALLCPYFSRDGYDFTVKVLPHMPYPMNINWAFLEEDR